MRGGDVDDCREHPEVAANRAEFKGDTDGCCGQCCKSYAASREMTKAEIHQPEVKVMKVEDVQPISQWDVWGCMGVPD